MHYFELKNVPVLGPPLLLTSEAGSFASRPRTFVGEMLAASLIKSFWSFCNTIKFLLCTPPSTSG